MEAHRFRFVCQVIGVDADTVAANQAGPEWLEVPFGAGRFQHFDRGLSLAQIDGLVEVAGPSVDIVKLGWGTALATGNLQPKLERLRAHGIPVVLGGTLTELAIRQGRNNSAVMPTTGSSSSPDDNLPSGRHARPRMLRASAGWLRSWRQSSQAPARTLMRSPIVLAKNPMNATVMGSRSHTSRPLLGSRW